MGVFMCVCGGHGVWVCFMCVYGGVWRVGVFMCMYGGRGVWVCSCVYRGRGVWVCSCVCMGGVGCTFPSNNITLYVVLNNPRFESNSHGTMLSTSVCWGRKQVSCWMQLQV